MLTPWRLFLCQMALNIFYHIAKEIGEMESKWRLLHKANIKLCSQLIFTFITWQMSGYLTTKNSSLCLGGQDIFATVRENSPTGEIIAHLSINGDPGASSIRLCLTGENADWFYLEGRTIRLNSSFSRTLDREVLGSVLIAALTCYEDDIIRSRYRIMVEILNENDNMPYYLEDTIQPRYISELLTVNSMVFTVKARDGDGDTITYMTDKSTADASYFRIDLPNSGMVILDKPLDYETKTQLQETTTKEKYSTTATVTVNVLDGDDQYPQFQPCAPVYEDGDHNICTNPVYSVNITETDEDAVLYFSPGPIHAEDGDKDILTPLVYSILSGDGNGRFTIDSKTGEISLRQRVENRLLTPSFRLRIMAAQVNDPKKYSVATALVHVVSENRFPPFFNKTVYKGFLIESSSPATLVTTYGNQVLVVQAIDRDFRDGINPKIHYTMQPLTGSNKLYHISQDGIVIAKTDRLRAFDRHILEVIATDEESGETAHASVDIEVLQRGQPVPRSPFGEERLFGDMNAGMAGGIAALVLLVAVTVLFLFLWLAKRRRERRDPADRGAVALGKHPNVSLRWFQQVNSGRPISLIEDASYHNEAFIDHEYPSDLYTNDMLPASIRAYESERPMALQDMLPILVLPEIIPANTSSSALTNGNAFGKSVSFKDDVGAAEETLPKNEGQIVVQIETRGDILMPVMQQDTFATATAENPAETFDVCCPDTSVRPREECVFADANEDDEDDNDPYKNMASVIYSSDEDTGDDEPNDLRHYYKHGQNQYTIDHMKAIGLQIEDSDESQA
ncbi:cadherin-related family member 5-like isoform X2 [Sinocyclocheilus grahami]|uniref:cadherin-related family member 5-like isoform X2 n=1 Tax=Sinocyclocheilus grahami TaxID=75366 RepID=UPI0007ACE649|nr:PREDICTED: cadherin-related family member 5-like isoform X2 [Sinocyclocheilus grahami]